MAHIFFDLDGTLIDSAPSILAALADAFLHCGVTPALPLDKSLVGPPLVEIIAKAEGSGNTRVQTDILHRFIDLYDVQYCTQAAPFDGILHALQRLSSSGHVLYVVTNKRLLPTRRIVEHLCWGQFFPFVYSPDSFSPPMPTKTAMLAEILRQLGLKGPQCAYVGDTTGDWQAATANNMPCFFVAHGYGTPEASVQSITVNGLVQRLLSGSLI